MGTPLLPAPELPRPVRTDPPADRGSRRGFDPFPRRRRPERLLRSRVRSTERE
ncbi:MAG: hypothetical protein J0L84_07545 [Verrucomicrobia bacterium]|nr:hypothetical protein [Verrucomicrobiota bacterium]